MLLRLRERLRCLALMHVFRSKQGNNRGVGLVIIEFELNQLLDSLDWVTDRSC